jgi:hypothetical protein
MVSVMVAAAMDLYGYTPAEAEEHVRKCVAALARAFDEVFAPTCDDDPHPCPALRGESPGGSACRLDNPKAGEDGRVSLRCSVPRLD